MALQLGLCRTWLKTPETGFLVMRLISYHMLKLKAKTATKLTAKQVKGRDKFKHPTNSYVCTEVLNSLNIKKVPPWNGQCIYILGDLNICYRSKPYTLLIG